MSTMFVAPDILFQGPAAVEDNKSGSAKNMHPSLSEGNNPNVARQNDRNSIRITNLSDYTTESDLEDLVKPFGPIKKRYLVKNKETGVCKGFAYVHFKFRRDAVKAIETLNGFSYNNNNLNVDWSKPPSHTTQ